MIALLISGGVALVLALAGTPLLIRWLQAQGIGQQIREDGPEGHVTKAGTPTMGGLCIVGACMGGYVAGHLRVGAVYTRGGILVALVTMCAGAVGLVDDWIKVRRQRSLGLNKRAKIAGQLVVAGGFAYFAHSWAKVDTVISFTRQTAPHLLDVGVALWIVWAVLAITGASNAVNLTDGLDGLAAGSSTFTFSFFAIIGFWQFRHFDTYRVPQGLDLALIAVSLSGACAGFLWWNAPPARIFMGDTGSLAIGAAMAALALVMKIDLLLPVVGGLYVLETVSVMIQVASFRFFHRRVFRMAPIHHHFELAGWPETTVIIRFWILAGLCTALALGLFYADFISLGRLD
ncbi:MAG TPA: phospho-N-acetylmuramoyl-pentapeptide-transferase [Acidimicrobiales bacterium]|nr:phospho-N-acetylmuramoyl-pentapeptide-transferase [Acidimicrobiales bacterium]